MAKDGVTEEKSGLKTSTEGFEREDSIAEISAAKTTGIAPETKSLVILQMNCRSICNKVLEFWNQIEIYSPDVIIGTESWLYEDINNAEVFRGDYMTFRRDRCSRGGGVFICVKNHIDCRELWKDEEVEMIAVEIKSGNQKLSWEIVAVYRAPNEGLRVLERLVARTRGNGNTSKRSIIGGDLNLPHVDWNGKAEGNNAAQALINRLVWDRGFSQVVEGPTRGDAILDVYLVRPESSLTSSKTVQGISDHQGIILEVDWEEKFFEPQRGRVIPVYKKTDVLGLQTYLRNSYAEWASNGSSVEQIWNNFKTIVHESMERFVPHKTLKLNSDPEYYNKYIKQLKVKVRKAYNKSKLGGYHRDKLKQLSRQLLAAKKQAQETYFKTILSNEGKCWADFYKYVKRRKGSRENIPAIKESSGRIITDPTEKANSLNFYYSTIFSREEGVPQLQGENDKNNPFKIDIKTLRRRIRAIKKNKSVGPDRVPGEILKMGGKP